jgi:crotonobetainyl-CoA:carnitine CoA-transferase CaiB-like acyl-CoA transferase
MSKGTLSGIKVLDFGQYIAGPFAAMLLAEQGADVTKVEKPGGDPFRKEDGFLNWNRSKKAITLDLKQPAGLKIARDLAGESDIIVENFAPGVMERLGLGYESIRAVNPSVIYCSISGFGTKGPYSSLPGYEQIVSSLAGVYAEQGYVTHPLYVVLPLASIYSAVEAAFCTVAALCSRETTGNGQRIEISMFRTILAQMRQYVVDFKGKVDTPWGPSGPRPLYRPYEGSDGKWFFLGLGNIKFFTQFARLMGHDEWVEDPIFDGAPFMILPPRNAQVMSMFRNMFVRRPAGEWVELLQSNGIPCAPVQTVDDFMDYDQLRINDLLNRIGQPGLGIVTGMGIPVIPGLTPGRVKGPAPSAGQHTEQVLKGLGCKAAAIRQLRKDGVVR